jgi:hypothetical protein
MGWQWLVVSLMGLSLVVIYLVFDIIRQNLFGDSSSYNLYLFIPMIFLILYLECVFICHELLPRSKAIEQDPRFWAPIATPFRLFKLVRKDQITATACFVGAVACLITSFLFNVNTTYFRMLVALALVLAPAGMYFVLHWLLLPEVQLHYLAPLLWTVAGQITLHELFIELANRRKRHGDKYDNVWSKLN